MTEDENFDGNEEERDDFFGNETPFPEEFDSDDVINRHSDDDSENEEESEEDLDSETEDEQKEEPPELDIDSILDYDFERHKREYFDDTYQSEEDNKTQQEIYSKTFKDFLVMKNITGKLEGIGSGNRIPSERIVDKGKSVKIADDPTHMSKGDRKTTVIVHRNDDGDITNIEVLCACGERTNIELGIGDPGETEGDDNISIVDGEEAKNFTIDDDYYKADGMEPSDEEGLPEDFPDDEIMTDESFSGLDPFDEPLSDDEEVN